MATAGWWCWLMAWLRLSWRLMLDSGGCLTGLSSRTGICLPERILSRQWVSAVVWAEQVSATGQTHGADRAASRYGIAVVKCGGRVCMDGYQPLLLCTGTSNGGHSCLRSLVSRLDGHSTCDGGVSVQPDGDLVRVVTADGIDGWFHMSLRSLTTTNDTIK